MICTSAFSIFALATLVVSGGHLQHGVRSWSTRDGLPQNSILDLAQTPDGVIWLATHAGLVEFDGRTFEIDDVSGSPEIGTSRLTQVEVSSDGALFIATARGDVLRQSSVGWDLISMPCPCKERVRTLRCDSNGALWIGMSCGLYRVTRGRDTAERISSTHITTIAIGPGDAVYVGGLDGVSQVQPVQRKLGALAVRSLAVDPDGRVYAARGKKVLRLDGAAWTELPIDAGNVQQLGLGSDGSLWVAGVGVLGSWLEDRAEWQAVPNPPGIVDEEIIHNILLDREGNLWLGSNTRGLFVFYKSPLQTLAPATTKRRGLHSVAWTSDHKLFALGMNLCQVEDEGFTPIQQDAPASMAPASTGGLWLDTSCGIELHTDGVREVIVEAVDLLPGSGALLEARDGTLWFGRNDVLCHWNGTRVEEIELAVLGEAFLGGALFEDTLGRIWIGGTTGLAIWDGVELQSLLAGFELPLGEIRSFYESDSGAVWVGTYGSGLCRISGQHVSLLDTSRGLFENIASTLVPDGRGNLLVMGTRAITRYSIAALEAAASDSTGRVRGRVYSSGPEIGIFEGNGVTQPRVAVGPDGHIWFPTLHGLVEYDPAAVPQVERAPLVRVRSKRYGSVSGRTGEEGNRIHRLNPDERDLFVQFSAASFIQPRQVTYRYRLLGREPDWIVAEDEDSIRYSNLPPGDYRFQIQAAVADGPFGPINSKLIVQVPPTLLERTWAKILIGAFALFGISSIAICCVRRARRRSFELEKIVGRRTGELRNEITERRRIEEDLRIAGDDLELQVQSRTDQLAQALDNLERDIQEREGLELRVRESEKLEIVGRLAGGLAHDFNNILTAVLGETDLAMLTLESGADSKELMPAMEEHLERVRDSGLRASRLTRQLLAYSRQQVMQPEVIDPLDTLVSLRSMLTRLVPDSVEIVIADDAESRPVLIDPGQLEQVIVNLVVNAAEAMPDGGLVKLGCRAEIGDKGEVWTVLTVTDSGVGMLPEMRDQIFEPFFSTKGKARGLGLASVQGIVLQSGGSLDVEENTERGLTFSIGFPTTNGQPREPQPAVEARKADGVVALLIDDEVEVRRIARLMLEGGGVRVLEASTHQEALALAQQHGSDLDILVTDVVMPHMNGNELSVRVREICPNIKVLFISGHFREELSERDLLARNANFLAKPFDARELVTRVADLAQPAAAL